MMLIPCMIVDATTLKTTEGVFDADHIAMYRCNPDGTTLIVTMAGVGFQLTDKFHELMQRIAETEADKPDEQ